MASRCRRATGRLASCVSIDLVFQSLKLRIGIVDVHLIRGPEIGFVRCIGFGFRQLTPREAKVAGEIGVRSEQQTIDLGGAFALS